jgi:hypothetical protein
MIAEVNNGEAGTLKKMYRPRFLGHRIEAYAA